MYCISVDYCCNCLNTSAVPDLVKIAVGARLEILDNSSGSFSLRHKHGWAFPVCAYYRWCRDSCSEALRAVPTPRSQREAYKAECMRTARHFFIEAKLFTSSRIQYFEIPPTDSHPHRHKPLKGRQGRLLK